ncbi:MAG: hypothetical protein PHC90_07030 [Syntrophorhabdaceae bacterium]|nr:hypothetical protein [Syntrophorhabdaceae bacterium]
MNSFPGFKIAGKRARRPWDTLKAAVIIAAGLILSGCINDTMSISVRPDGSGTIEETVLMGNEFIEMMQNMGKNLNEEGKGATGQAPAQDDATKHEGVVSEMMEKAKNNVKDFGEGVRFVSVKPAKTDSASGYTALYAFDDIGKVTVNQNPGGKAPLKGKEKEKGREKDVIRFVFTEGSPARLSIHMPSPRPISKEKADRKGPAKNDPGAIEMMKAVFKDMKVSIALTIEGDIVKTNATYRSGRKITLVEMDFGRLISHAELLQKIDKEQPQSIEEMKTMLKNIEGLKLEFENPVIIDFK